MRRRAEAVVAGLVALIVATYALGFLLGRLSDSESLFVLLAMPLAGFSGGFVCSRAAGSEAKPAAKALGFIFGSWFAVPLFTGSDRPGALFSTFALLLNVGAIAFGSVAGAISARRRHESLPPRLTLFRAFGRFMVAGVVAAIFGWLSFEQGSFLLALPAIVAYLVGRDAVERVQWGASSAQQARAGVSRALAGRFEKFLGLLDKLAFACVIGVIVRLSAEQVFQNNLNIIGEAQAGGSPHLHNLDPNAVAGLVAEFEEYRSVRDRLARGVATDQQQATAALERCADKGNPHCQVLFGGYLREVAGPARDLERARHYTWLALRSHHHPVAFNNMLVYLHESSPEPYSEWLNTLQSPENVDRIRDGLRTLVH